jgi:hypothetical protein
VPRCYHKLRETLSLIPLPMWHKPPSLDTEKTRCFYILRWYTRWRIGPVGPGEPSPAIALSPIYRFFDLIDKAHEDEAVRLGRRKGSHDS